MLSELKELGFGLGMAILLLFAFVWIRERILNPRRLESKNAQGKSGTEIPDSQSHAAFEAMPTDVAPKPLSITPKGAARVNKIFIASKAGALMQHVSTVQAIANRGLEGDRYCTGCGYWSESDKCEVTLIAQEDLDHIEAATDISVQDGQHRRNIVTKDIDLHTLKGKRFRIGTAYFSYQRPRPPCLYIQKLTEPGMVKALAYRSGICVRCFKSGVIHKNDRIILLNVSVLDAIKKSFGRRFGLPSLGPESRC